MSLKSKLYLAFIIMILLSVFTAVISINALRETDASIQTARREAEYVVEDLIPANDKWLNISTQTVAAGLNYYAYALSFEKSNFDIANTEIATLTKEFQALEAIHAAAPSDRLPNSRAAIVDCRKGVDELQRLGQQVSMTDLKLQELNRTFIVTQDEISAIADEEYISAYEALKDTLKAPAATPEAESESAEDDEAEAAEPADADARRQAELDARSSRVEFLSDVFDNVAWSNQAFWRGHSLRGEAAKKYYDESQQHLANLVARIDEYNTPENVPDARERGLFNQIKDISRRLIDISSEIENSFLALERLTRDLNRVAKATGSKAREAGATTARQVLENGNNIITGNEAIEITVSRAYWWQLIVLAGTIFAGMLLAWLITRGIVNPIDNAIRELTSGAGIIANAASNIASASQSLAEGANQQASSMEETSAALEQIASMSKMSAENASKANGQTRNTVQLIQEGSNSMTEMSAAMSEINERSEKVSLIIKTIEDIAFQTNLLALNAAVEAARAGEAGKGFAVVADEVRNLSQRSAAAARDTTVLIQETVASIKHGSDITQRLAASYQDIQDGTRGISDLVEQIAQAANEQTQGVEQVNHALSQMDHITQSNSASSEETASASGDLSGQMDMLHNTVGQLSALVHGGSGNAPRVAPAKKPAPQPRPRAYVPPKPAPRLAPPPPPPPVSKQTAVMRPDDIIPLEGDFEDF